MACPDFLDPSPENPDCAWCGRFAVNLDRAGRLCGRCRRDAPFRARLEEHLAARQGGDCRETAWCERFGLATNPKQCAACRKDPAFRAFLFGQARARASAKKLRAARMAGCRFRGGRAPRGDEGLLRRPKDAGRGPRL
ncbi:MAG: hypothetical protein V1918_05545 [Planctomycetota bacterium]